MSGCQEFPPPTSCLEHFRTLFLQPCNCLWKGQAHLSDSWQGTLVQEWSGQRSQRLFQENWTEPCASLSPGLPCPWLPVGPRWHYISRPEPTQQKLRKYLLLLASLWGLSSGSSALNCRCGLWKPGCGGACWLRVVDVWGVATEN